MASESPKNASSFKEMLSTLTGASEEFARGALAALEAEARLLLVECPKNASNWFDERTEPLLNLDVAAGRGHQGEILLLFSQWYMKEGDWAKCVSLATKAVNLSRAASHFALLRRSLNILGSFFSKTRELDRATVCFAEALQIAEALGDRIGKCGTLVNLAECRFNAGLLDESIALNEHVIELATSDAQLEMLALVAHHNIAITALTLSDLSTASRHIEAAASLFSEPKAVFPTYQRIVFEVTYTRILIALDRFDDARKRAQLARLYADRIGGRLPSNQARLAEALCDMVSGQPDAALWALERLKQEVQDHDPLLRDVMEAEILGYRQTARHDEARRCQQRYLFHLAEWQRKYALRQIAGVQRTILDPRGVAHETQSDALVRRSSAATRGLQYLDRLESLATLAELREDPSGEHAIRVGQLTGMLAKRLRYKAMDASIMERAARLHDIGKLAVPDAVIFKRGKLSRMELDVLRRHTFEGCQMLTDVLASIENVRGSSRSSQQTEVLRVAAQIALHHHEWWDGSGYPRGMAGEAIPECARLVSICDWFDELTHGRIHRKSRTVNQSIEQIMKLAGTQFDPRMCTEFSALIEELKDKFGEDLRDFASQPAPVSPFVAANQVIARVIESATGGKSSSEALCTPAAIVR